MTLSDQEAARSVKDLDRVIESLALLERTDRDSLDKLGGVTYIHYTRKQLTSFSGEQLERAQARKLLDSGRRMWNRWVQETRGAHASWCHVGATMRMLALAMMRLALANTELRQFGDDQKKSTALNFAKLALQFAGDELLDYSSAQTCCEGALELVPQLSADRTLEIHGYVACARARMALTRGDKKDETSLEVSEEMDRLARLAKDATAVGASELLDLAQRLVRTCRELLNPAQPVRASAQQPVSRARAEPDVLAHMLETALGVCELGLRSRDAAQEARRQLDGVQTNARLFQAVLWSDSPEKPSVSRALQALLMLPEQKKGEPKVQLCVAKCMFRVEQRADGKQRVLQIAGTCNDFDTCHAGTQLLRTFAEHEARADALLMMAKRGLDGGDVGRRSMLVRERFVCLHADLKDTERALEHLDTALAAHNSGTHALTKETFQYVHAYLFAEFTACYESGTKFAQAAGLAKRAAEWCAPSDTSKRAASLRSASWSLLKESQPAQALDLARKAMCDEPHSPKGLFIYVLAATQDTQTQAEDFPAQIEELLKVTEYDPSVLEVLSSTALECGRNDVATKLLEHWLERGTPAAADGRLLLCVRQLHRVAFGERDPTLLKQDELKALGGYLKCAVRRLPALAGEASCGTEDDVWWCTVLGWNLAFRANELADHQLAFDCLQCALRLNERMPPSAKQTEFAIECRAEIALAVKELLDSMPPSALTFDQAANYAAAAHKNATAALELISELPQPVDAKRDNAGAAAGTGKFETCDDAMEVDGGGGATGHVAAARSALDALQPSLRLVDLEMTAWLEARTGPSTGGAGAARASLLSRLRDGVVPELSAEHLELLAQRAASLEAPTNQLRPAAALGFRRAFSAYAQRLEDGGASNNGADALVRMCTCITRLIERLSHAEACVDTDLVLKVGHVATAGKHSSMGARPVWRSMLEWLCAKAEKFAIHAGRMDMPKSSEQWLALAVELQSVLVELASQSGEGHDAAASALVGLREEYAAALERVKASQAHASFATPLKAAKDIMTTLDDGAAARK